MIIRVAIFGYLALAAGPAATAQEEGLPLVSRTYVASTSQPEIARCLKKIFPDIQHKTKGRESVVSLLDKAKRPVLGWYLSPGPYTFGSYVELRRFDQSSLEYRRAEICFK